MARIFWKSDGGGDRLKDSTKFLPAKDVDFKGF